MKGFIEVTDFFDKRNLVCVWDIEQVSEQDDGEGTIVFFKSKMNDLDFYTFKESYDEVVGKIQEAIE